MNRNLLYLLILIASVPVLYSVEYYFSDARQQKMNMQKAEDFIPIVQKALDGDSRFSKIELFSHTYHLGSLGVGGSIHAGDVEELKRRVEGTSPPVKVAWLMEMADETIPQSGKLNENVPAATTQPIQDWRVGSEICAVHHQKMDTAIVHNIANNAHVSFLPDYMTARAKDFPHAGIEIPPECYSEEQGMIYVCPACVKAREAWHVKK